MNNVKELLENIFSLADIKINGDRPYDIQVHDQRFYKRVLDDESLGLGESYMDGWWDCERLDQFFTKIAEAKLDKRIKGSPLTLLNVIINRVFNHITAMY